MPVDGVFDDESVHIAQAEAQTIRSIKGRTLLLHFIAVLQLQND